MSRSQSPNSRRRKIFLFDVDGTLTKPRMKAEQNVIEFLHDLKKHVCIGFVGGSDLVKIKEQLGDSCITEFDYGFSENGLVSFCKGDAIGSTSIRDYFGEDRLQKFIKFCLRYIADLDIPKQRGTFIEFRTGMVNVSPIGRNCSQAERDEFELYDHKHQIRTQMIDALKAEFPDYGLTYSIGGQISFDVFPNGWDKRYCLSFLEDDGFDEVHFFGDKTHKGGNDHEIFEDSRTVGHSVTNPEDTIVQVLQALGRSSL